MSGRFDEDYLILYDHLLLFCFYVELLDFGYIFRGRPTFDEVNVRDNAVYRHEPIRKRLHRHYKDYEDLTDPTQYCELQ